MAMPHSFAAYSLQSTFDELQAQIQPVLSWKPNRMMAVNSQFDKALLLVGGVGSGGELPLDFHDFIRLLVLNSATPQKIGKASRSKCNSPPAKPCFVRTVRKILPW